MNKLVIQKITPHLWFENNAEEAATFYTSIFKNSKITDIILTENQLQRSPEDQREL
jgi:predicted 3-demethylubiquinone-9 3-methyltransferase (glyoxalase superfamily)